ncbi:hypothetical protein HPB49_024211 [Dermacentor silvarum]|uniref:Uncharacterized protein n=1 Tax=Dermacentor silvarum TaxID=543639 RepID=A0ACB8CTI6_DERSI|nr:hypothetical protein HPB49_024211 [Dermacentor silvarum]
MPSAVIVPAVLEKATTLGQPCSAPQVELERRVELPESGSDTGRIGATPGESTQSIVVSAVFICGENFKLKQELAAVKARQAKDSAQLHALIARIGSPPESTECHSQNNPNRHATPKIPPSLPTPTDSAVTREEIREMLSALSQQLSQQFSIVFTQHLTQFGARLDSLETRLDTQIAETGGNIRRKRATRSSRTTEDQVPLRGHVEPLDGLELRLMVRRTDVVFHVRWQRVPHGSPRTRVTPPQHVG